MTGRQHEERIENLFLRGYSLDLICELGAVEGWTRHDARAVLAAHGWPLDWAGRLQGPYLALDGCQTPGMPQPPLSIVEACPEKVIAVAADSNSPSVRFKAQAAQHAIDDLRMAMLQEEEHEAVVAHRRARAATKLRTYVPPERPVDMGKPPERPVDKINNDSGMDLPGTPPSALLDPSQRAGGLSGLRG